MKYLIVLLCCLVGTLSVLGQTQQIIIEKGTVSFVSSKNVYVKFDNTENIQVGDTLFLQRNNNLIPTLVVTNKSSSSTVCTPLVAEKLEVGASLKSKSIVIKEAPVKEEIPIEPKTETTVPVNPVLTLEEEEAPVRTQKIRGRFSAASYSNLSNYKNSHRMRYAFSLRGNNIAGSKLSTDTYVTFRHTLGEWEQVRANLGRALKVYSLAASYDFTPSTRITLGRKINPLLSSVGAIDGIQFEKRFGNFLVGAVAGTRPDYSNYGFNATLPQYGAFVNFSPNTTNGFGNTTLGFMEQRNGSNIDRRFAYFQHTSQLTKELNVFGSFEVDLFENINNQISNQPRLTNLYVSLRYRLSRNLRFSASFDTRRNIIYYESYKNFIDQLIEDETRQGLRLGVSFRPTKTINVGINSGMRFQKSNANPSQNINAYVSFSKLPWLNIRTTIRASLLETDYLSSRVYGIRFSKPLIKKKINTEWYYRNVNYLYKNSESGKAVRQHIAGLSMSYRLSRTLSLHVFYEGTFDKNNATFSRINARIIKRF